VKGCVFGDVAVRETLPSKLFHVTIASVALLDETRRILGPPDENAPGQRNVFGELDYSIRNLICREQARRHAARLALSTINSNFTTSLLGRCTGASMLR